jgi:two-component system, NarL family, nitrate/nitrite response regulator NarL
MLCGTALASSSRSPDGSFRQVLHDVEEAPVIRVLVVAGAKLYREALTRFLEETGKMSVIGLAATPGDAPASLGRAEPDMALVDSTLIRADEIDSLLTAVPELKVIALGLSESPSEVILWAEAGASGYVSNDASLDDLLVIIESVARGELPCSDRVAAALVERLRHRAVRPPRMLQDASPLTARQQEVMQLVARGLTNKEIAQTMSISLPTVKNHMHNIFERLQVHGRADALARMGRYYETGVPS